MHDLRVCFMLDFKYEFPSYPWSLQRSASSRRRLGDGGLLVRLAAAQCVGAESQRVAASPCVTADRQHRRRAELVEHRSVSELLVLMYRKQNSSRSRKGSLINASTLYTRNRRTAVLFSLHRQYLHQCVHAGNSPCSDHRISSYV